MRADTTMPWCKKGWLACLLELRHLNSAYSLFWAPVTWGQHPQQGDTGLLCSHSSCLGATAGQAGCGCSCLFARDQGDVPHFMWSNQDLWITKAHFVANSLDALPNAGINSSTIHAAFSKENKRSWKSSWANSVQKTTHRDTGKDEAGRFLWLNQLVTLTSCKNSIVGGFFVLPFFFESPVSLVRRKYHPGVRILEAENGFTHTENSKPCQCWQTGEKKKWGSWYMCKAHCEWHTANKTNSLSEQQWISQKPLSFEQESLNELRNCASHITFLCEWIIVLAQKVKKKSLKKIIVS